jgi:hypothetical protein
VNAKFLLVATLVGGIALFVWGAVWHMALPFSNAGMHEFANNDLVVDVIGENAPQRGIYFSPQGIFAAVNIDPGLTDRTASMGPYMLVQLLTEFAVVFVLTILLFHSTFTTILGRAVYAGIVGLAGALTIHIAHWNWYSFPTSYTLSELANNVIGFFLVGLVVGWLMQRMSPARAG